MSDRGSWEGGGWAEGRGEGLLQKDEHSERHISGGLRRSDSVKLMCRKRKREGKGVGGRSRGGKGQGSRRREEGREGG